MYNLDDIKVLVAATADLIKNAPAPKRIKLDNDNYYDEPRAPDFTPAYNEKIAWMRSIEVHARKGVFPEKLFIFRSPNQTDKEYHYTRNNYKQVTLPNAVDYQNTIKRCFHNANWSITYATEPEGQVKAGTNYRKYVTQDLPHYGSVENYVKNVIPQNKTIDANGVIVVRPLTSPMVPNQDETKEATLTGDLIEPVPIYYDTSQVVSYKEDDHGLFLLKEKSSIDVGNKKMSKEGLIFEFYDKNTIWRATQTGKKSKYQFDYTIFYQHNLGYLLFEFLKGTPVEVNTENVWQSPYLAVTDILDQVLLDSSHLMAVKATCVYPYRIMVGDICEFKMTFGTGDNSYIETCNGRGQFHDNISGRTITCEGCGGDGMRNRMSPQGVLLLKPKSLTDAGDTGVTNAGMSYASPPIDTPQFLRTEIQNNQNEARKILHLHTSNSEVKGSDNMTATGMSLDVKALYAFIKPISDQIFDLYKFILKAIGDIRYNESFKEPTLIYPQQFDFYTEGEYLTQISEGIEKGLPGFMTQSSVRNYIESMYFSDERQSKVYDLILKSDRLIHLTPEEITSKNARGLIADWEVILHDSSLNFLNEMIAANPEFLELEQDEQIEALIVKAKEVALANTAQMNKNRLPIIPPIEPPPSA